MKDIADNMSVELDGLRRVTQQVECDSQEMHAHQFIIANSADNPEKPDRPKIQYMHAGTSTPLGWSCDDELAVSS